MAMATPIGDNELCHYYLLCKLAMVVVFLIYYLLKYRKNMLNSYVVDFILKIIVPNIDNIILKNKTYK